MAEDTPHLPFPRGGERPAAFALVPEREKLFAYRVKQFTDRTEHDGLADYPRSFAVIASVRAALLLRLPAIIPPLAGAVAHGMPPVNRNRLVQVHVMHLIATLIADALRPVDTGLCSVCGGTPVASVLVGRSRAARKVRSCVCATFAMRCNAVRVSSALRGIIQGVAYQYAKGHADGVDSETRDACYSDPKIMNQTVYLMFDAAADDVTSLGLDMMLRDVGWRHAGVNSFLAGY